MASKRLEPCEPHSEVLKRTPTTSAALHSELTSGEQVPIELMLRLIKSSAGALFVDWRLFGANTGRGSRNLYESRAAAGQMWVQQSSGYSGRVGLAEIVKMRRHGVDSFSS